jgi:hypothetical protein
MEKTLVLGECKWTLSKIERRVIADLIEERAARIIPAQGSGGSILWGFHAAGGLPVPWPIRMISINTLFKEKTGYRSDYVW